MNGHSPVDHPTVPNAGRGDPEPKLRAVPGHGSDDHDPLAWLSAILWPDGSAKFVAGDRSGGHQGSGADARNGSGLQWWASPSRDRPKILIPADSMPAAGRAVRRYHDGFDIRQWARSVAAELTMSSGYLAHRILADRTIVLDGPDDAMTTGVFGALHEMMGRRNLRFAISLAAPKTNRKPVIQILDETGPVLGWAKIGWNPWTERLVTNEATWLSRPSCPPLVTPTVLATVEAAGSRVVVQSSLAAGRRPPLRRRFHPDPELVHAIARRGTTGRRPVGESAWWASVDAVLPVADADERAAIERVLTMIDGMTFSLGAWHGDFTPWNTMTVRGMAQVIDWEFAADEVPLGFDLCHFHTQVADELFHRPAADALNHSARLSPQGLAALGVDPHTQIATWYLYLVELVRRTLALRAAGLSTAHVYHGPAAVDRLNRLRTTGRFTPTPP